MKALLTVAKTVVVNVVKAALGKKMLVWVLRFYAKQTDTLVDDRAVDLLEAGLNNDRPNIQKAIQALVEQATKEYQHRRGYLQ